LQFGQKPVEVPIDDGQTEMDEEQTLALESTEELKHRLLSFPLYHY
jgi:hypothetical protein